MKSGFMDFVATRLIPDHPGQTARWYAREYLQLGDNLSDAKNPEDSLANTLDKQVREGKEKRVSRERVEGRYRFFPIIISSDFKKEVENVIVQISLSKQELDDIDNIVAVDKFKSRNDTIKWLLVEGMKAKRDYLDKVRDIIKQIEEIKKQVVSV